MSDPWGYDRRLYLENQRLREENARQQRALAYMPEKENRLAIVALLDEIGKECEGGYPNLTKIRDCVEAIRDLL